MFATIIIATCGFVAISILCSLIKTIYATQKSFTVLKKHTNNLPIADRSSIFGGHIWFFFDGKIWKYIEEQFNKHGRSFGCTYSDNIVIFTHDLNFIQSMIHDEPQPINRLFDSGLPIVKVKSDSVFAAQDDKWRRIRKAVAPALASHKIKIPKVQQDIAATVEKFIQALERKFESAGNDSIVIDVEDMIHRYSLAVVFTCFYKRPNEIDFDADKDWWQSSIERSLHGLNNPILKLSVLVPVLRPLVRFFFDSMPMTRGLVKVRQFVDEQAKQNYSVRKIIEKSGTTEQSSDGDGLLLKDGSVFRRNLVDYIIDQLHDKKLSYTEFKHSGSFLFLASNKTTADAIAKCIYLLAVNPDAQTRVRAEVLKDGQESEYLTWCIDETMRLFPPVTFGCSRELNREMISSDGYVFPKESSVVTPLNVIHRLKEYWGDDADEFRPERFRDRSKFHPMQFMPFGAGLRKCPGGPYAISEARQLMVALLSRYKFEHLPNKDHKVDFDTPFFIFTAFKGPTNIRFKKYRSGQSTRS